MEGVDAAAAEGHGLSADGDTNINRASADLVGDVVDCFETGRTEPVYAGGAGGVWDARCERGGAA